MRNTKAMHITVEAILTPFALSISIIVTSPKNRTPRNMIVAVASVSCFMWNILKGCGDGCEFLFGALFLELIDHGDDLIRFAFVVE